MELIRSGLPLNEVLGEILLDISGKVDQIISKQDRLTSIVLRLMETLPNKTSFLQHPEHYDNQDNYSPMKQQGCRGEEKEDGSKQDLIRYEKREGRKEVSSGQSRGEDEEQSINRSKYLAYEMSQMEFMDEQEAIFQNQQDDKEEELRQMSIERSLSLSPQYDRLDIRSPSEVLRTLAPPLAAMNLKFTSALKLYQFPSIQPPPMEAILDKSHVLLLMKLERSKQIIGAFTEIPFSSKPVRIPRDNPKSFLFNLSQEHFLFASKTNKTHSVDRNYLMFGNWEVRLQVGQKELYSDAGKKGGCFMRESFGGRDIEGDPRAYLFGQEHQQQIFQLSNYLIYVLQ